MTQGELVTLTVFNIMVNKVVRAVMIEVCAPQEVHNKIGCAASK